MERFFICFAKKRKESPFYGDSQDPCGWIKFMFGILFIGTLKTFDYAAKDSKYPDYYSDCG